MGDNSSTRHEGTDPVEETQAAERTTAQGADSSEKGARELQSDDSRPLTLGNAVAGPTGRSRCERSSQPDDAWAWLLDFRLAQEPHVTNLDAEGDPSLSAVPMHANRGCIASLQGTAGHHAPSAGLPQQELHASVPLTPPPAAEPHVSLKPGHQLASTRYVLAGSSCQNSQPQIAQGRHDMIGSIDKARATEVVPRCIMPVWEPVQQSSIRMSPMSSQTDPPQMANQQPPGHAAAFDHMVAQAQQSSELMFRRDAADAAAMPCPPAVAPAIPRQLKVQHNITIGYDDTAGEHSMHESSMTQHAETAEAPPTSLACGHQSHDARAIKRRRAGSHRPRTIHGSSSNDKPGDCGSLLPDSVRTDYQKEDSTHPLLGTASYAPGSASHASLESVSDAGSIRPALALEAAHSNAGCQIGSCSHNASGIQAYVEGSVACQHIGLRNDCPRSSHGDPSTEPKVQAWMAASSLPPLRFFLHNEHEICDVYTPVDQLELSSTRFE